MDSESERSAPTMKWIGRHYNGNLADTFGITWSSCLKSIKLKQIRPSLRLLSPQRYVGEMLGRLLIH